MLGLKGTRNGLPRYIVEAKTNTCVHFEPHPNGFIGTKLHVKDTATALLGAQAEVPCAEVRFDGL